MKKMLAFCLCLSMMVVFAGCSSTPSTVTDPSNGKTSSAAQSVQSRISSASSGTQSQTGSTDSQDEKLQTAITNVKAAYAKQGYDCKYVGDDSVKKGPNDMYRVNVKDSGSTESGSGDSFYVLRVYSDKKGDKNAASDGTVARYYVRKSSGAVYFMNPASGVLTEITAIDNP